MQPITLISGGSRGDVQPFILLGRALQEAGQKVLLALPPSYREEASRIGLDFRPLRADFDALLAGQAGRNLKNSGRNPLSVMREGRRAMQNLERLLVEDVVELAQDTRVLVGHIGLSACLQAIAAVRGVPLVYVSLQPFMPTRDFPHPLLPLRLSLGSTYNRLTGNLVKRITWNVFKGETNRLLESRLNVKPVTWQDYSASLNQTPILNAFSTAIIPFPADWKPNNCITGFWFSETLSDWQPSPELEAFLETGPAPVFIGFGSVSDTASVQVVLEALKIAGERGVLVGFNTTDCDIPETVMALDSVPYEWLFARVKAAVHHGGAGTTAQALRAKLPMLAVPQVLDQFFWAERVFHTGAALKPIAGKTLTPVTLAEAIHTLATDKTLKERAALLGEQIQAENGLKNAVEIIQKQL